MSVKSKKQKSNKTKILRIFALIMFLVGVIIIVYPYALQLLYSWRANNDYRRFVEQLPDAAMYEGASKDTGDGTGQASLAELYRQMQIYNDELYINGQSNLTDPWAYEQSNFNLTEYGFEEDIIGYIKIPKINLILPIYLGASTINMQKGAAHLGQTSLPIGGENTNSVICGHRGYPTVTIFNHLIDLEKGDEVIVTNLWYTMTYRVVKTTTIQEDEVDKLMIQDGKDMLSLFTCYYQQNRRDRFVVYCERYEP